MPEKPSAGYRGRLAPTPTGELHLGHARTFFTAWKRARESDGTLFLRMEDLDRGRCKPVFSQQVLEDMIWLGLDWDGPVVYQSRHPDRYLEVWQRLKDLGYIYPCFRSRKELRSLPRPEQDDEQDTEPVYPAEWRPPPGAEQAYHHPKGITWRFRVPEGDVIRFSDGRKGPVCYTAGKDFGDFSVWRRDNVPAYELSVVADDIHQNITEVVRGEDLLRSTARQLLIYRALQAPAPSWFHTPLVRDADGKRLAKRFRSLSIRELRNQGKQPEEILHGPMPPTDPGLS